MSGPVAKAIKNRHFAKRSRVPCFYCETLLTRDQATVDHRIPWSKGGRNDPLNVVIACNKCNQAKGDALPDQYKIPDVDTGADGNNNQAKDKQ